MPTRNKYLSALYYLLIFAGLFTFFYIAHPLIIFNADDWYNASYWRRPLPIIGGYNAIKVFPETFMPLVSEFGAFVIYPILKDYLKALSFAYALALVFFIMLFIILLEKLLDHFTKDNRIAKAISFLTLIFCFLIYKNDWYQNTHLFCAQDVTCVFHYTISALLNLSLVLFFLTKEVVEKRNLSAELASGSLSFIYGGLLILAVYLAVFSNMFNNIVLVTFSGVTVLTAIIRGHRKSKAKEILASCWLHFTICCMFIFAIILQLMDRRNEEAANQGMVTGLFPAITNLIKQVASINKMLILVVGIIVIAAIGKILTSRKKEVSTATKKPVPRPAPPPKKYH